MSFRRKPSRRQGPAPNSTLSIAEEGVENPNAFGLFGHQYQAPTAVQVEDHEDRAHRFSDGSHYPQYASQQETGWHSVQVQGVTHQSEDQQQSFHQEHHSGGGGHTMIHQQHSPTHSGEYNGPTESEGHAPLVIPAGYGHPTASQTDLGLNPPFGTELHRQHSDQGSGVVDFEQVHSAKGGDHLQKYGSEIPIHWRHLFKRLVVVVL